MQLSVFRARAGVSALGTATGGTLVCGVEERRDRLRAGFCVCRSRAPFPAAVPRSPFPARRSPLPSPEMSMSIMSDRWITRMARECAMIEPFEDRQVRKGVISYGVSSYGYDMRVAREFRIFTNVLNSIVDPKQ